jgi:hypothetical protein
VHRLARMRTTERMRLACIMMISCLVGGAACRSAPARTESPVPITRAATHEEELTLIRADSEMFAAIVGLQLAAGDDDYPRHIDRLRYDPRPYGTRTGYPEVFAGVQGIDPTLTFARAGESAMADLIDVRRQILKQSGVRGGPPVAYSQCAGVRVPVPPPPRGTARSKQIDVHAGCPRMLEYYVTVGLPIHGQPEGLWNARDTRGRRVALRGDVWTALVDEHSAGPLGWSWAQYAWLFKRRGNDGLELAAAILIRVIE